MPFKIRLRKKRFNEREKPSCAGLSQGELSSAFPVSPPALPCPYSPVAASVAAGQRLWVSPQAPQKCPLQHSIPPGPSSAGFLPVIGRHIAKTQSFASAHSFVSPPAAVRRITCVVPLCTLTICFLPSPCHNGQSCSDLEASWCTQQCPPHRYRAAGPPVLHVRSTGRVLGGSSWTSAEQELPVRAGNKCRERRS